MNSIFDSDRWNEIWQVLMRNKLRTFLTGFGVLWGIFMLVVMLGFGNGLQNGTLQMFGDGATNSVFIWTRETSVPYKGLPRGRQFNLKNDDMTAALQSIPDIEILAPRGQQGGWRGNANNVVRGKETAPFTIMGDYPSIKTIEAIELLSGRFLNEIDVQDKRKVCVLGTRVQEILFQKEEDPINDYIQIQGIYFKVIGVCRSKSSNNREDKMNTIYIPFSTFQQTFNWGDNIGWFAMTAKPDVSASKVLDEITILLKQRHSIAPEDQSAIGFFNLEKEFQKFSGLFLAIKTLIWIVGTGTLLAGVIGISNIMLIVVRERTREIGVRRALGATPASIITQIILEAVVLTLVAGYAGLVGGVALLELAGSMIGDGGNGSFFARPEVNIGVAINAITILLVAGIFAGLIPARRAVSISTVEALRSE